MQQPPSSHPWPGLAWLRDGPALANAASWLLIAGALVHAVMSLAIGWDMPLLDRHSFRQTHTALSAWTIAHGGPVLAYETPLFGAPWAVPLEFPFYQWLVVASHAIFGGSFDENGRAVACAFYLACLLPLWYLLRSLDVPTSARRLTLACFLVSPLYVYWSRAFLMESTVLFFSMSACAIGLVQLAQPRSAPKWLALGAACGALAAMIKLMTFCGLMAMLGWFWVVEVVRRRKELRAHAARLAVFAGVMFVVPMIAGVGWSKFTNHLMSENALTRDFLITSKLIGWTFGTLEQKLTLETWQLLWDRTLSEAMGHQWLYVVCIVLGLCAGRSAVAALGPVIALIAVYGTFTNVHVIHDYYQCATGVFVIITVGVGLAALERTAVGPRALLLPLVALISLVQSVKAYEKGYAVDQERGYWLDGREIGRFIRDRTPPESTVLIYGEDWSSVLPYYAERRTLMNRWKYPLDDPRMRETIARTNADGHPFGALVSCWNAIPTPAPLARELLGGEVSCEARAVCVVCVRSP